MTILTARRFVRTASWVLALGCAVRAASAATLVSRQTTWRYFKGTAEASDPRDEWRKLDFVDTAWSKGAAPIGYDLTAPTTPLTDMKNGYSSFFIRKTFTVTTIDPEDRLRASVYYDDGFIIWINGEQVQDDNAPDGEPLRTSLADGNRESELYETNDLPDPADVLEIGENVIAVQVFNASLSDDDCKIDVELSTYKRVADTVFSHNRGFYTNDFYVTISTATAGATIRYTTTGTAPTATTGSTNPVVHITTTTCLRAAAYKSGYEPTDVDTHTYIFLDDVLTQTRPAGYPTRWVGEYSNVAADYDMDRKIVTNAAYSGLIRGAFAALPTLSIAMKQDDMFASYATYTESSDKDEEFLPKPCSMELVYPPGLPGAGPGFQVDCGIRSHSHFVVKRSLRLVFKKEFGPAKLRYPFFETDPLHADSAVDEFDRIVLRANQNDAWTGSTSMDPATYTLLRDQWARDTLLDMTGYSARGVFMHLYINGIYWGVFNPTERPDHSFTSDYFGGEKENWFACNHGYEGGDPPINGDPTRFNYMRSTASKSTNIDTMRQYLDTAEFIDYLVLNWFDGNGDWPGNNWYAGNSVTPAGPAKFFAWDAEKTWYNMPSQNAHDGGWVCAAFTGNSGNWLPTIFRNAFSNNATFRVEFGDRIYKHCFNKGALADANCIQRWLVLSNLTDKAIIAESARWGDIKDSLTVTSDVNGVYVHDPDMTYPVYTRNGHWYPALRRIQNIMDGNVADFIAACRATSLAFSSYKVYPSLDAPNFHQHGGAIASGFALTMSNPNTLGTVFYTLDGSEPRKTTGSRLETAAPYTAGIALSKTTHVKARVYRSAGTWSAVHAATYNFTAHHSRIRFTEILYNPLGGGDFEFVELKNTGTSPRGLSEMTFTDGIRYTFAPGAELPAGGFAVLVRNEATFTNRYPGVKGSVAIFGVYGGGLDALII